MRYLNIHSLVDLAQDYDLQVKKIMMQFFNDHDRDA